MQKCDLCATSSQGTFDPKTLCAYHRSQYEYAMAQHVAEQGADGIRFAPPDEMRDEPSSPAADKIIRNYRN